MEDPGVGPSTQDGPAALRRTADTKTRQEPAESTYRNGLSLLTGAVARVVYGGLGKVCAGAPFTPAKTWFHTALDQGPMLLLRTRNCCCDPLVMAPVFESDR